MRCGSSELLLLLQGLMFGRWTHSCHDNHHHLHHRLHHYGYHRCGYHHETIHVLNRNHNHDEQDTRSEPPTSKSSFIPRDT
ncbi:hypothetical protein CMUS01_02612 [Colletotrichum musicola]|uniref:Secreted protein n=1 Tax=Colletotrichum musicola TaxID=2175873 RepID=A0A8H6NUT0_9PEZI|nr:hypothetical protein CMUS01_02612 [Colletotrichum musicola]